MKEITSWTRSCPSYIVLLCPVNLLFWIFYCGKNFHVLWKNFIFGGKNFRDFLFYYFRRQKLSRKLRKFLPAKVSAPKVYRLPCKEDDTIFKQKLDFLIQPVSKYLEWIKEFIYLLLIFSMSIRFLVIHY